MSAEKKRIPRNMARIEFLACRDAIESLLSQGFDKRKIHTRLAESGQFTMSYDAFCKVLAKAASNNLKVQSLNVAPPAAALATAPVSPASQPRQSIPRVGKATQDTFQDPRNIAPSTII